MLVEWRHLEWCVEQNSVPLCGNASRRRRLNVCAHPLVLQEPEPAPPIEGMEAGEEEDEMGELADMPTFSRKDRHVGRGKVIVQSVLETGEGAYEGQEVAKSQADLDAILAAFRDKPLFSKLDDDQHNMVASIMQRRSYAEGEALMNEGENGDTFFIIGSGTCSVEMGGRHLKDMPAGGGFGEIALIYNQPRTSTVVAKTPVEACVPCSHARAHLPQYGTSRLHSVARSATDELLLLPCATGSPSVATRTVTP